MKKLIMLAGLLAVFNLSMAGVETGGDQVSGITAEVGVDATVVEPLEIESIKNVNIGLIPKGTTKEVVTDAQKGKIKILGEKGKWVKLSLKEQNDNVNLFAETKEILLSKGVEAITDANKTVAYTLKTETKERAKIGADGSLEIVLGGTAKAGNSAESVNYGKILNFKVVYDFDNQK